MMYYDHDIVNEEAESIKIIPFHFCKTIHPSIQRIGVNDFDSKMSKLNKFFWSDNKWFLFYFLQLHYFSHLKSGVIFFKWKKSP